MIPDIVASSWSPDGPPWIDDEFYLTICGTPQLPAWIHLLGAVALFEEGWFWVDMTADDLKPRKEFEQAMDALVRMQEALTLEPAASTDADWQLVSTHPKIAPFMALARKWRMERRAS